MHKHWELYVQRNLAKNWSASRARHPPSPTQQAALEPPPPLSSLHSSSAPYHSCQQFIQERAKAPAVSCFSGLHDPPHFCRRRQRGVRAGGREHQWPHCAEHISLPAEAPSLQLVPLGRELEKPGDTSLTWSTVQLFPCLAAVVGLHLCPLAKEGETDMTCSTRVKSRKVRTRLEALKPNHIPATGSSQGTGPLSCLEHRATEHPLAPHQREPRWPSRACPRCPTGEAAYVGSKLTDLSAGCGEERNRF